jgi:hypothetical protein
MISRAGIVLYAFAAERRRTPKMGANQTQMNANGCEQCCTMSAAFATAIRMMSALPAIALQRVENPRGPICARLRLHDLR